jgi:hypothetical protein
VTPQEAVQTRKSQSLIPTDEQSHNKLSIEKFADGGLSCLKFAGTIDESFEGKKLGASTAGDVLVVDLGAVKTSSRPRASRCARSC